MVNERDELQASRDIKRFKQILLDKFGACQECGSDKDLHVHHNKYGKITIEDLELLCVKCHNKRHRGKMLPQTYLLQTEDYADIISELLNEVPNGLTNAEIMRATGLTRHNTRNGIEFLKGARKINTKQVGRAQLHTIAKQKSEDELRTESQ